MITVVKDDLNLYINCGSSCILKFLRVERAQVVFQPNPVFWGIWERNKQRLKQNKLSVEKDAGVYQVKMPIAWYKLELSKIGREKFKEHYDTDNHTPHRTETRAYV